MLFPTAIQIDESEVNGNMRYFTILGKRANAFICKECNWIKMGKSKTSILRKPSDYVINHECNGDHSMRSASNEQSNATESTSSMGPALDTNSQPSGSSFGSPLNSSSIENCGSYSMATQSSDSMATQSSNSMAANDSNSQSLNDSMASNTDSDMMSSMGSSTRDSGFRTPDIFGDVDTRLKLFCCENRFSHSSTEIVIKMDFKCQFKSYEESEFKIHQKICPMRYRSNMARSNPAYLSTFLWSFAKELEVSDYLGKLLIIYIHVYISTIHKLKYIDILFYYF